MKVVNSFNKLLTCVVVAVFLIGFSAAKSQAQTKTIRLKLIESASQIPVTEATASLINLKDNSVMQTLATDKTGLIKFEIAGAGKYSIVVDKAGYKKQTSYATFSSADKDSYMYFTMGLKREVSR